jgi:crotonobetainyl-CoA:carnitine CoA-transferase CaiB-like acyl-CoA transferase
MLDAVSYFNFPELMEDRTYCDDPAAAGERPAPRSFVMATADGWLAVAPATGGQVQAALRAVGHPEWVDAVRAVTDPIALIAALLDRLESVTVTAPTAAWLERFGAADVPVAEVFAPDAHLADPQVIHNGVYGEVDHPVRGRMRYVRYPARFASDPEFVLRRPAPSAGQHTEEVFAHAPR